MSKDENTVAVVGCIVLFLWAVSVGFIGWGLFTLIEWVVSK